VSRVCENSDYYYWKRVYLLGESLKVREKVRERDNNWEESAYWERESDLKSAFSECA
jgi:hypothetical protein